jgi:threonine dehydratase
MATPDRPRLSDIIKAQRILSDAIKQTPLEHSKTFSAMANAAVYMKLENLQSTGSFKVRGAINRISALAKGTAGVVCASAGNHAQGVAYAASKLGIPSRVFMPVFTPPLKVIATRAYGADVVLTGESFDDAFAEACLDAEKTGSALIHAFDDPLIIAGQGTIALEIFTQLNPINAIAVPIGGGGLIAGIAIAIKELNPDIKIIGVEADGSQSMKNSLEMNTPETLHEINTIADGIAVKRPGELTFKIVRDLVDEVVVVNDSEIARTTYMLLQRAKLLAEPSGAAALAAVIFHKSKHFTGNVVPVISGGNINMGLLQQVLEKGMMDEQLRARIAVVIPDMAGELKSIITILEKLRANIHEISHDRSMTTVPVGYVMATITFNLQSADQLTTITTELQQRGMKYQILK